MLEKIEHFLDSKLVASLAVEPGMIPAESARRIGQVFFCLSMNGPERIFRNRCFGWDGGFIISLVEGSQFEVRALE